MDKDFIFGVATSAYQIEGTNNKFTSIWDTFTKIKGSVSDGSDGLIACDHENKYIEDIQLIKDLGVDSYRLSISWARIQPQKGMFSEEGITFYKNILKELKRQNILPSVTLYHWDLPDWIKEECGGWNHPDIIEYFFQYSKVIFEQLDDYIHSYITINEPWCVSTLGYLWGVHAPGVKDEYEFIKAHYYTLVAHGKVAQYYRANYKKQIGITLNLWYDYSLKDDSLSKLAVQGSDLFHNLIYLEPLFKGDYPREYYNYLSNKGYDISFMTRDGFNLIQTKCDFLGINYYTRNLVKYDKDQPFKYTHENPVFPTTEMGWEVYPEALRDLIRRIRKEYTKVPIVITENGSAYKDTLINNEVHDYDRKNYLKKHLDMIVDMSEQLNISGYYAWSLMDNFEWAHGYTKRFGLVYVNYETQKRYKKDSYYYYQTLIKQYRI